MYFALAKRLCLAPGALVIGLLLVLGAPPARASDKSAHSCTRTVNDGLPGTTVKPSIALKPEPQSAQRIVNFGTHRKEHRIRDVRLDASRALPLSLTAKQLNLQADLSRASDTLESADFPEPRFTDPDISQDRKTITFDICLIPTGIAPGKYVGNVVMRGPSGLGSAAVGVTANAKAGALFGWGLGIAFFVSLALLWAKDAVAAYDKPKGWGPAMRAPWTDLRWWVATVVTLGGAFGLLLTTYQADPAWGAAGLSAVTALVGTGLSAVGGHAILTSLSKSTA